MLFVKLINKLADLLATRSKTRQFYEKYYRIDDPDWDYGRES